MMSVLKKSALWLIIASGVTILMALLVTSSVAAQVIPELDPAGCSDGSFVTEPEDNPDLVSDCEALIAIRNHWTNNPANNDLPSSSRLLTWGRGDITTWEGAKMISQSATTASIDSIGLRYEGIAGSIPEEFAQLKNLFIIDLSGNRLTGVIPDALGELPELWSLNLSHNNLSGTLPAALGKLAPSQGGKLHEVYLLSSGISGPIPDGLVDIVLRKQILWEPKGQPYDKSASEIPHSECNNSFKGRFCDEDGHVHESNIETIAEMGITLGCSSDRFCPHEYITRAQMAAFLYRAIEHKFGTPEPAEGTWWLADVPDDAWYRRYVEWAVSTQAMESYDVIFNPSGRVTRIEMAKILAKGFPGLFSFNPEEIGELFEDVKVDHYSYEHISSVHSLYNFGVTSGCSTSPLLYCPDKPVNRGQMASFIVRALNPPNDPRYNDELGLIAHSTDVRSNSLGNVTWEVWSCDTDGQSSLDLDYVASQYNKHVTPYYLWLSGGQYNPKFVAGDVMTASNIFACVNRGNEIAYDYFLDAYNNVPGNVGERFILGIANDPDLSGPDGLGGGRVAAIDGRYLLESSDGDYYDVAFTIIIHEIGHVLDWPHSYGGLVNVTNQHGSYIHTYDNLMDKMSGCQTIKCGTIAINRYAAGWIDPSDVAVHPMPSAEPVSYELSPVGVDGYQMLVIPSGTEQGVFYTLGVRVAKDSDSHIPKEGVEVYFVDQRTEACPAPPGLLCYGVDRRTQPHPPPPANTPRYVISAKYAQHVYQPGDVFFVDEVRVEITERHGDRFLVKVG